MDEIGAPLDAFPAPTFFTLGTSGPNSVEAPDLSGIYPVIFALVFIVWALYTLVAAYHWFRYGHLSFLAVPMLALHLFISGALLLATAAGVR